MKRNSQPILVVVAYNRIKSLSRILSSLDTAHYPSEAKLLISIDNDGKNQNVNKLALEFNWRHGEKEVIYHKKRLGLRNHIIKCGDLSYEYDSVIILEDDLFVSPYFYQYALEALNYYEDCKKIAGISLYNLTYTEADKQPFIPLQDNSDVYFKQVPSSLGQVWNKTHWDSFKQWYKTNPDLNKISGLPSLAKSWPEYSWKKYFYAYLVLYDKYFVFPLISFSTNFNDEGTNMITKSYFGQTQIRVIDSGFKFRMLKDSLNVYDAYSEILPDKLNKLCNVLSDFDYEVDLYGRKEQFEKEYILTGKPCKKYIKSFERTMKPQELNIIFNIEGGDFVLARREDVIFKKQTIKDFIKEYTYFYINVFTTKVLFNILKSRLKNKIRSLFKVNKKI